MAKTWLSRHCKYLIEDSLYTLKKTDTIHNSQLWARFLILGEWCDVRQGLDSKQTNQVVIYCLGQTQTTNKAASEQTENSAKNFGVGAGINLF